MVEALVSKAMEKLATIIGQEIQQEVQLVMGAEKDIEKLSRTFTKIQSVLKDAEKKQIMNDSVGLWVQDLKDIAYDIDDVLDEWGTAILKSNLELQIHDEHVDRTISSTTTKVCFPFCDFVCFPFCNLFSFKKHRIGLRNDIGHRIKDINERLDQIAIDQNKFGFIVNIQTSRNYKIIEDESSRRKTLETSSLIDVKEVFGRNKDQDIIISKLLSEGSSQQEEVDSPYAVRGIPIVSIVGMPGLGKTTLAQTVFNDDRVTNHFLRKMWIHVPKPFDKIKVAMKIIIEMGGNINNDIAWEVVHRQLTSSIDGKQFLLVLDDVWNDNPMFWDPLRLSLQCGSQGSRIIVTTRNKEVAEMMDTTYVHMLGLLSHQDCWSILSHCAFVGRQKDECEKLKEIGMELANKCDGLPLSAKTLGCLLRFKKSKQEWQRILESDLWRVLRGGDKLILPALMLSYNDLPSHLKQCFAQRSVIPKGYCFSKDLTIREWFALGFLSDRLVENDGDLLAVAYDYFDALVVRSFFEKVVHMSKGHYESFRMHDLVHDFAKSLVEKECLSFVIKKDTNAQEFDVSRARHLFLHVGEIQPIPSFFYKAKNVRNLLIFGQITSVSSELFHHLKFLRNLDLGDAYIDELPDEIEKLVHLRWLRLSNARFHELPKTVTHLCNLRGLILAGCINLRKIPEGIERLLNLVELELKESRQISYLPKGIGKLTKLRLLSNFIIGGIETGGCKLEELKDLNFLEGTLQIIGLGRVENGDEAKMACLKNKQKLRALYFHFDQYFGASIVDEECGDVELECMEKEEEEEEEEIIGREVITEEVVDGEGKTTKEETTGGEEMLSRRMEDVLENLQPHPKLEKLIIQDYLGAVFPRWMVSQSDFMSFSNLVFLELRGWRNCKQLPPTIGKLPSLETLVIAGMDKVKFMGMEFFAINGDGATRSDGRIDTIFPKLKVFDLDSMWNLEEWDVRVEKEDGKEFIFMPRLHHLVLGCCPKLRFFPQHLTSLRILMIVQCPKLSWMPSPSSHLFPSLPIVHLILKMDAGSFSKSLVADNRTFLPQLKLLRVKQSPYSSLPQGLGQLTSLEYLDIRTCSKIRSIPEGELQHLTALKYLTIMRCPALRRRCQKEIGEDWSKISHIPEIFIDQKKN